MLCFYTDHYLLLDDNVKNMEIEVPDKNSFRSLIKKKKRIRSIPSCNNIYRGNLYKPNKRAISYDIRWMGLL